MNISINMVADRNHSFPRVVLYALASRTEILAEKDLSNVVSCLYLHSNLPMWKTSRINLDYMDLVKGALIYHLWLLLSHFLV